MKYSFFIEGADNVGKTTTIQALKDLYDLIDCNYINYNKYPSSNMTELMNASSNYIKALTNKFDSKDIKYKQNKINTCVTTMESLIEDMSYSLIDNNLKNPDEVIINDRGPLSTCIYQYIPLIKEFNNDLDRIVKSNEDESFDISIFKRFFYITMGAANLKRICKNSINQKTSSTRAKLNIIILYNNEKELQLSTDKQESIDYKKNFDNDTDLQNRINSTIDSIVNLIKKSKYDHIYVGTYRFSFIPIYNKNKERKTPEEIAREIAININTTIKERGKTND